MIRRPRLKITFFIFGSIFILSPILFHPAAAQSIPEPGDQNLETSEMDFQVNLPIIFRPPDSPPAVPIDGTNKTLYCSNSAHAIPDNDPSGYSSTLRIEDPRYIADLDVRLDIDHTWVGDLIVTLHHEESGKVIELINRPGVPPGTTQEGCKIDNVKAILDDDVSLPVENECSSYPAAIGVNSFIEAAIAGSYVPEQSLELFTAGAISGQWTLTVADLSPHDTGRINQWCMAAKLIDTPDVNPPPPPPSGLPKQAYITGVSGQGQALPLDCESRSAVDWARYFGVGIDEYDFFFGIPDSDNPDSGFVGNVYGTWGQIPPAAYGVHAEPIAKRLRQYGLQANAESNLSWNHLKAEISSGHPVIVWILGSTASGYPLDYVVNGIPVYYQSNDGFISTVARYEHTVILTGYNQDSVSYLNGGTIYQKSLKQFLESWSALGNMAVLYQP
jgi:subtilisin-like proprotein convertase family protein/uncharacterized protein YvpB